MVNLSSLETPPFKSEPHRVPVVKWNPQKYEKLSFLGETDKTVFNINESR